MSPQATVTQIRLNNITRCLTTSVETLEILSDSLGTPFLGAISTTTQSLVKYMEISRVYTGSHNSSNSISMLPSEPKIFYGRESELLNILKLFSQQEPRIAILGAGGMGKTSLARAVLHHTSVMVKYGQHRYFVACDTAATKVELTAIIGAHLGLKPSKDLTHAVVQRFSHSPPCLLILDILRHYVEHLALMITMRGAERPAQVRWTRPFVLPLRPLEKNAARKIFIDIADDEHNIEEVDKVLSLSNNMPLAISLLANVADSEGCSAVLSRWEAEKTSMISEGYDKRSNLDLSISLSLSKGLSDVELLQSKLPIKDIWKCKAALTRTSLAYVDEHKRLEALVPIREYMHKTQPPQNHIIQPLLKHFQDLLELYITDSASGSHQAVTRILSNFSNIQNILSNGLKPGHPGPRDSIYCTCDLNSFSLDCNREMISLISEISKIFPKPCDYRLEAYFITELINSWKQLSVSDPDTLITQALEHFNHFDDPGPKCRVLAYYYVDHEDLPAAINICQTELSLAISMQNTGKQCLALCHLAWCKWYLGDHRAAQGHAYESQRLAKISSDLFIEAKALHVEAVCWTSLGNYQQSISLCNRARDLSSLCGLSGGELDHSLKSLQAEVHRLKSEYGQARIIHAHILQNVWLDQDPYKHAIVLFNFAQIDGQIDAPQDVVQRNIDWARTIFSDVGDLRMTSLCDVVQAELSLRKGDVQGAKTIFCKIVRESRGQDFEKVANCLERLGDVSCWGAINMSSWTTVFLAYSLKSKAQLEIHKALQFLGDVFLAHGMRIQLLGDIHGKHSDLLRAVELWQAAKPLFAWSSQAKRADEISERLANTGKFAWANGPNIITATINLALTLCSYKALSTVRVLSISRQDTETTSSDFRVLLLQ
ncbi:hypothetical protein B0H13DRAFT_2549340 [Mycena leptocephala]|nr:hypothetical protein B0H13DRAFT_2549340 [Mycena leptocephala]